jgi:DNA-binding response OmpR family regulator
VVDDDASIRLPLAKRLEMEGFRCQTAEDGEEGFSLLADGFDLVLTDVDMPRLDGFGLLEKIRSEPDYKDIPVIIMTAHARSSEEVSRGLDLGANDYVRKPFDMGELVARTRTQLRIRQANRMTVEKQRDLAIIELAGAAAHEINNPLSVVMARLELLLEGSTGEDKMHKDLEQIDHLVRRIADVVQKMSQVKHYQVQNYCGGINIMDLDAASQAE